MLAVDVVDSTTGEVYRTFDLPWWDEGKRYIKGWIKKNGYVFERVVYPRIGSKQNTTVWVSKEVTMKRQLEIGDTIKCQGITATIASITFQEPWEWREAWYLEFTDTNGVYRSWKQNCDGGRAYDKEGKEI